MEIQTLMDAAAAEPRADRASRLHVLHGSLTSLDLALHQVPLLTLLLGSFASLAVDALLIVRRDYWLLRDMRADQSIEMLLQQVLIVGGSS